MKTSAFRWGAVALIAAGTFVVTACTPGTDAPGSGEPTTAPTTSASATSAPSSSSPSATATATSSSTSKATPEGTQTVSGPGFTVSIPADWKEASPLPTGVQFGYVTTHPVDGFAENIVATHGSAGSQTDVQSLVATAQTDAEAGGATCGETWLPSSFDGESSAGISCEHTDGYRQLHAFSIHAGQVYYVTYSAPISKSELDTRNAFDDIIDTWHWSA